MTWFSWFLQLIGFGRAPKKVGLPAAPSVITEEKAELSAASSVITETPPTGPWDILWDGELHRLKAAYDKSWGGNPFFTGTVNVVGAELTVTAVKQGSGGVLFFAVGSDGSMRELLEVVGSRTLAKLRPGASAPTKDIKEAVVILCS